MSEDAELRRRAEQRVGTLLKEKYRIERVLGAGGMAVVYQATHRNQKRFAVKMLHPELSIRSDIRARFIREGYAANSVGHSGVVSVLDDDVAEDGATFIVMELLEGASVEELFERSGGALPPSHAVAIVHELLDVLAVAHEKGVVHRDIKPANLFITSEAALKVLDFGIARVRDAALGSGAATGTGMILGTPAFMAPEQALAKARDIDARTDLWAAGATLFTLLSGRPVHEAETAAELVVRAATTRARGLASVVPTIPPAVARVVDQALAFEREQRWQSAGEMRKALADAVAAGLGQPLEPRRELASLLERARATQPAVTTSGQPGVRARDGRSGTAPIAVTPQPMAVEEPVVDGLPKRWSAARLGVVLGAAVLLLGGVYQLRGVARRRALATTQANAVRCLVGDRLAPGEVASARFRAIQVAATLGASRQRAAADEAWPTRCSGGVALLANALEDRGSMRSFATSARQLATALQDSAASSPATDLSQLVDSFFGASAEAELGEATPSDAVPAPPDPARGMLEFEKTTLGNGVPIERVSRSPFLDAEVDFLLEDARLDAPLLCHWPGASRLSCRKIPPPAAAMSPGLQLWGTTAPGVPPFVFAGARGKAGVFRSDTGQRVIESIPFDGAYGALARSPDTLDYLVWQDASPHMLLRRTTAGKPPIDHEALDKEPIRFPYFSTALAWEWFVYRAQGGDADLHVFVRRLTESGALGRPEEVGRVPEGGMVEKDDRGEPHMSACRSASSMVLRLKGYNRQFLSLYANGQWTPPVVAPQMSGSMVCREGEATVTSADWSTQSFGVTRTRCSLARCSPERVELGSLLAPERGPKSAQDVGAFEVRGKTLLLWYAGKAGGLRMRLAAAPKLDDVPDTLLLDDHLVDGRFVPDSIYRGCRGLQTSEGALLLLVHTTRGLGAFTLDADERFKPVIVD